MSDFWLLKLALIRYASNESVKKRNEKSIQMKAERWSNRTDITLIPSVIIWSTGCISPMDLDYLLFWFDLNPSLTCLQINMQPRVNYWKHLFLVWIYFNEYIHRWRFGAVWTCFFSNDVHILWRSFILSLVDFFLL